MYDNPFMQSILENNHPLSSSNNSEQRAPQNGPFGNSPVASNQDQSRKASALSAVASYDFGFLKLIQTLYIGMLFLLPFFFLPITADFISINKAFLVIFVSIASFLLYILDGLKRGRLTMFSLKSYWGILLLTAAVIASAYFSISSHNSIFGHYGNYTDSVMYIVALVLMAFVASNVKLDLEKLLTGFTAGVTVSTILSFLGLAAIEVPYMGVLPAVFSFSGHVFVLFSLQIIAVAYSLYLLIARDSGKLVPFAMVALVLNGLYLSIGLNVYALIILVIAIGFLYSNYQGLFAKNSRTIISAFIVIALLAVLLKFVDNDEVALLANSRNFAEQPRLTLVESWLISAETVRDFPLTGSGVGTFVNVFSFYRPASLNVNELWDVRFESPFSDLFLWLATTGLIGVTAYALFWVYSFKSVFAVSKESNSRNLLVMVLIAGFLSLLLLGSNPVLYALLFIIIGVAIQKGEGSKFTFNTKEPIGILLGVGIVLLGYVSLFAANLYASQIYFASSMRQENPIQMYELQARAIERYQFESVYIRSYISTAIFIATEVAAQEELSDAEREEVVRILSEAISNAQYLTSFEPTNVANWVLKGDIYSLLIDSEEEAAQLAFESYSIASQLEPTNPRLFLSLGSIYYRLGGYEESITQFARAIQLKPDYANAYYNLAFALKDAGYVADAVTQLEVVLRLVPEGTEDYIRAEADLEEFRALAEAAADDQMGADIPLDTDPDSLMRQETLDEPLTQPGDFDGVVSDPSEFEGAFQDVIREDSQGDSDGFDQSEEETQAPPADGSTFDESQGESDAPIATPESEEE